MNEKKYKILNIETGEYLNKHAVTLDVANWILEDPESTEEDDMKWEFIEVTDEDNR